MVVYENTGVAACNIGGVTLHRWTGIGRGDENIKVMLGRAFGKKKEWRKARVLVIDEISMVRRRLAPPLPSPPLISRCPRIVFTLRARERDQISADLFDKVEYIARRVRNWNRDPAQEDPRRPPGHLLRRLLPGERLLSFFPPSIAAAP